MTVALCPLLAEAATEHTLNESKRIEAPVSAREITRITVQDDRIQQVFGADGKFNAETDEESGQLFVKPLDSSASKPVNLTVVTENGITQDLKLVPQAGEAESIILKSTTTTQKASRTESAGSYAGGLVKLVQGAASGNSVEGHNPVRCPDAQRSAPDSLKLEPLQCWQGASWQIVRYRMTSQVADNLVLSEEQLARSRDVALALGAPRLKAGQATSLIVISKL